MKSEDACALLQKKLEDQHDSHDVATLAAALGYLPLAIIQAAAYISHHKSCASIQQYLEAFRDRKHTTTSLVNYDVQQLRQENNANDSSIATWQMSFDHTQQTCPSAADLLSLMSFFDRQDIPACLLRKRNKYSNYLRSDQGGMTGLGRADNDGDMADDSFENDIVTLQRYSLISVSENGVGFRMHALVHSAMRQLCEVHGQQKRWRRQCINSLEVEFQKAQCESWTMCQSLFPHIEAVAAEEPKGRELSIRWASLLSRAGHYGHATKNWPDAGRMLAKALNVMQREFGPNYHLVSETIRDLTLIYYNQGRWDEAEELQTKTVEIRKCIQGAGHHDTLSSMAWLASIYHRQGRWQQAEKLGRQTVEIRKITLGMDHGATLESMAWLALTYYEQGRLDKAEELQAQLLETRKNKLGINHPDTLAAMRHLACMIQCKGRNEEALDLMKQCVHLQERVLGKDHHIYQEFSKRLARWEMKQAQASDPGNRTASSGKPYRCQIM